jgi:hypothetical protein
MNKPPLTEEQAEYNRGRGIRILISGILLVIGAIGVGYGAYALDQSLASTHQQVNPNNGLIKALGVAGLLFIVVGPIMVVVGLLQVITRKDIWAAITKPM